MKGEIHSGSDQCGSGGCGEKWLDSGLDVIRKREGIRDGTKVLA